MNDVGLKRWFVIRTNSKCEKKCFDALQAMGIEAFFPTQRVRKQWSDRLKWVEEPLFRGYLFINIEPRQREKVYQTPHFFKFVQFNGESATVRESEIEAIKKITSGETDIELVDSKLFIGQEVFVTSGPFKGIYAKLVDFNKKGKLLLEVACIGQGILLSLGRTRVVTAQENLGKIG